MPNMYLVASVRQQHPLRVGNGVGAQIGAPVLHSQPLKEPWYTVQKDNPHQLLFTLHPK